MNGWLKWLPGFLRPVFVPGPKPAPPILQTMEECDCGRAHPVGWICNSVYKDTL